jgi:DNA-binding beta-propeller fold protein YncE
MTEPIVPPTEPIVPPTEPIVPPTEPATDPAGLAAPVAGTAALAVAAPPRRRRRRVIVLVILLLLLGVLALFTGWYLTTRKPISELPIIPPVAEATLPAYGFSAYGAAGSTGVATNKAGDRIYATQSSGDRSVKIFDGKGTEIGALTPPASTGADHVPVYVAVDPQTQDVYVSDRATGAVYVYSADGVYRRTFDPGKDLKGWQPVGLGFARDGTLYITDLGSPYHRVHQFAPDGALVKSIGEQGMFSFPNGVAVDAVGNLYVADSNNGRLRVFAPDGRELGGIPRGAREGDLGLPRGVAIDDIGRVYVVDTTANAVQVYKVLEAGQRAPVYVGKFGIQGAGDGQFQYPNGVAVDTRGHVFVTDVANNRIQVWSY